MNPSTSSNADAPKGPVFHVGTRALSPDLTVAGHDESPRDLGDLDRARLEDVLAKLGAVLVPPESDVDPHLVVKSPRGRFFVRPHRGRWLVELAGSVEHARVELGSDQIADYLADVEPSANTASSSQSGETAEPAAPSRAGVVVLLALVSVLALTGSAWFTFRPDPIDPDSAYLPVSSPAQLAALQSQVVGRFATAASDAGNVLEIRADGTLTWLEHMPPPEAPSARIERYTLALREGQPVLRSAGLGGPIGIQSPNTLVYAHETYTRQR